MPPDFVVLGHFARDEHADGSFTLGGVPTFAAITARNLGYRVGIVTSCADDLPQTELLHDIEAKMGTLQSLLDLKEEAKAEG